MKIYIQLLLLLFCFSLYANDIPDYGNEIHPDFLTPAYYNAALDDSIRLAINEIIHLTRQETLHHPLLGEALPNYSIFRDFCDVVGRNGNYQYHPARDFYVENKATEVNIYASHDGIYDTSRSISRYRHNISITKTIKNTAGAEIAKLTTVYAHVDLDLNSVNITAGDSVKRGDLICSHLYSGTMGGPHLHYEIRFYNKTSIGLEEFYAWDFDTPSSGPWQYGSWDTEVGIGYGNPSYYFTDKVNTSKNVEAKKTTVYPNPFSNHISFVITDKTHAAFDIFDNKGRKIYSARLSSTAEKINTSHLPEGLYIIRIRFTDGHYKHFSMLKKSS